MIEQVLTPNDTNPSVQSCPECQASLFVHANFVTWCAECNWNVHPSANSRQQSRLEVLYDRIGERLSKGLFEKLKQQPELKPRFTISKAFAFVIATLIHLITIVFIGLGLAFVINGWPHVLLVGIGIMCFGIAWIVRPQLPKRPEKFLTREEAPALFHVVDRISQTLNAKPIHGIVINEEFNAAYGQAGIRFRRYLYIGLPFFTILSKTDKVGILGHELAHGINNDPLRGFYLGTAFDSLLRWAYLIRPHHILMSAQDSLIGLITAIGMVPVNIFLRGLAKLLVWIAYGLLKLVYRDSQRAEYLADAIAAKTTGSREYMVSLEKIYLNNTFENVVRKFALNKRSDGLFEALKQAVNTIPASEIERLRRVNCLELARITTHPPTRYRVDMIAAFPVDQQLVEFTDAEIAAFDEVLATHHSEVQATLIQQYHVSLYR